MACQENGYPELEQQLAQARARITELETALQRQASEPAEPARCQELEAAHRRISGILDSITECYFAMDHQFRLTAANERAVKYFGRPGQPLLGRTPWEIHPHLADSPIRHILQKAMTQRVPVHQEEVSWLRPGHWLEMHVYPVPEGLEVYVRDITARKQTEQALQESEAKLRAVLENSLDVAYRRDLQTGRYDYMSPAVAQIAGLSVEEATAMTVEQVLERVHPEDRAQTTAELAQAMEAGRGHIEYRFQGKDGQYRYLADRFTVQKDAAGRSLYCGGVVRDITDRKRAEQQLAGTLEQRIAERTAQADQRGIQLQKLAIELTQAEQRERQRLAQVLHDHLQQLLVAARIRTKVLQIGLRSDPLQDSVRQVQELLEESIAVSRSLTLELSPPILHEEDLGRVLLWLACWMQDKHGLHVQIQAAESVRVPSGDLRYLLFRAVRELLFNVVKHARTEQAVVKVTQADDQVQVIVADQGRGFDPAAEPVERSVGGFGLASLRERLDMLGGQIRIDSGPGRGTQVTLRVPAGLPSQGSNSPTGPGRTE